MVNPLKAILALFKAKDEVTDVVKDIKDVKQGYKTLAFWLSLVGHLLAVVAAVSGLIPATYALIATVAITVVYNVLRGIEKSKATGVRNWWSTSEFRLSILTAIGAGITSLQTGGLDWQWLATAAAVVAAALGGSQTMAYTNPEAPTDPK